MGATHPKEFHRQAMQLIKVNKWDEAHCVIQDYSDPLSCRIHGLLHRIEGDLSNAGYWYDRAGCEFPKINIDEELTALLEISQP